VICEQWDVVVVPFPFAERPGSKRRPALVLSRRAFHLSGHTVLAMITSAAHSPWPGDTAVTDYRAAGLHVACTVRLKLFTLDNRLILKTLGRLSPTDRKSLASGIEKYLI